jgi:hypothetical protein
MSHSRQNVTWVEARYSSSYPILSLILSRVFGALLHSGSSLHISAEHGTTAYGHRATTRLPRHNYSNYPFYDYHGKAGSGSPCLVS